MSNLYEIILLDEDRLMPEVFLAKLQIWASPLRHGVRPREEGDKGNLRATQKMVYMCPYCHVECASLLDNGTRVFSCPCGRYWRDKYGLIEELHRLTANEASVELTKFNKQFLDEVEQLNKTTRFQEKISVPLWALEEIRQGIVEIIKRGDVMAFLTPDDDMIYALIDDTPVPLNRGGRALTQ